jgi:hypothetical protein
MTANLHAWMDPDRRVLPVPASVVALIASGQLPPEVARGLATEDEPEWEEVGEAVEAALVTRGSDDEDQGALALLGAYAWAESGFGSLDEQAPRRAEALLERADAHGAPNEDVIGVHRGIEALDEG